MKKAPIIRKGIYKDYLNPAIRGGVFIAILFAVISLSMRSVLSSLLIGLYIWVGIIVLFMGIAFPLHEYFDRKQRIKKLLSKKYAFLHERDFQMHTDLFWEGSYKGYFIRVLPNEIHKKWGRNIEYDLIEAYYTFDLYDPEEHKKRAFDLSGDRYFIGRLIFANHCVGLIPRDWKNPDFKENLDGLIAVLKRENLKPLSKKDWENSFGKELKLQKEKKHQQKN